MYKISKEFDLCYTHRVWTQRIDPDLSGGTKTHCPCKVVHGHNSNIKVELEGANLNPEGMLVDYVNLTFFKKFVDSELDHKTILDINDPWMLPFINSCRPKEEAYKHINDVEFVPVMVNGIIAYFKVKTNSDMLFHQEISNGLVAVKFVPTSENLCKWMYDIVNAKLDNICKVSSISFSETPKTLATYIA